LRFSETLWISRTGLRREQNQPFYEAIKWMAAQGFQKGDISLSLAMMGGSFSMMKSISWSVL